MDVWDPNEKTAEFGQIKKAINTPVSGFKEVTRAIVWGIFIVFYFFIFFLLVSGCSYMKQDDDEIIIEDLEPLPTAADKIACIKMEESCNV